MSTEECDPDNRTLTAITLDQLAHARWASDQFRAQAVRVQEYVRELERERDEALKAAQDMSAKLDARINVGADLDEAVRLLERVWPDIDPMRPTSEEVRAFLARHKEAQG